MATAQRFVLAVGLTTMFLTGPSIASTSLVLVTRAQTGATPVNPSARTMAAFKVKIDDYIALQVKAAAAGPNLPEDATPEQIDRHQRELAVRVAAARSTVKVGQIFDADMQALVRQAIARIFSDSRRRQEFRDALMEDNPRGVKLTINARYPDQIPIATMPPELLQYLPALPAGLEYRFVGEALIILDTAAHIVVDYMPGVLPA